MTLFARRSPVPEATGYSVIDEHMVIHGEIATQGTVRIDGRIEGRLHRAGTMIIGPRGVVMGDIEARELVVGGSVEGSVVAEGRVEVQSAARVHGDVRTKSMLLHEGGRVHGHLAVDEEEPAADSPRLELSRPRAVTSGQG